MAAAGQSRRTAREVFRGEISGPLQTLRVVYISTLLMAAFAKTLSRIVLHAALGVVALACAAASEDESAHALARLELLGSAPTGDALVRAVASRVGPVIDLFLAAKPDVNLPGEGGRTALLTATLTGDMELAARLLAVGADPRLADDDGVTPLMAAAWAGHLPTITALRARGATLDAADASGRTPLHYAIAARQAAVIDRKSVV